MEVYNCTAAADKELTVVLKRKIPEPNVESHADRLTHT